mgnify:CR=1 FL=1
MGLVAVAAPHAQAATPDSEKPNILFILISVPQVYPHKKGPPKCNFEKALYRSEEKSYSSL